MIDVEQNSELNCEVNYCLLRSHSHTHTEQKERMKNVPAI